MELFNLNSNESRGFMDRYFDSIINQKGFDNTKRYNRHKDHYRQVLNEYLVNTFDALKVGYKTGINEPVFVYCRDTVITFFNMICNIKMADTFEDGLMIRELYKDTLAYHAFGSAYSPAEKYLIKFIADYKDKHKEDQKNKQAELTKQLLDNSDGALLLKNVDITYIDHELLLDIADETPILQEFLNYMAYGNKEIWTTIPSYLELFNRTFDNTFFDFLHTKIALNSDICEENYIAKTKLEKESDKILFLANLFANLQRDTENIFAEICIPIISEKAMKAVNASKKRLMQTESEQMTKMKKVLAESQRVINQTVNENNKLLNEIDQLKKQHKNYIKQTIEKINELVAQNKDLQKKLKITEDKYDELNEYIKVVEYDENLDDETEVEIDTSRRYLFISSKGKEGYNINKIILDTFPNAKIEYGIVNIPAKYTDMVVILTSYTKHNIYYGIKEQCKNKNIPMIHCRQHSIAGIKRAIAGLSNYNT